MLKKVCNLAKRNHVSELRGTRRGFIKPAYDLAKKIMPKISATEDAALKAGTVGFDGDLFKGTPSLKYLVDKYDVKVLNNFQYDIF